MRSSKSALAAAALALAVAGCTTAPEVRMVDPDVKFPPKPKDCKIEVLRERPKRDYVEIAEIQRLVTTPNASPEMFRETACGLGADAVIVLRDFVTNQLEQKLIAVMAIKYRDEL